MVQLTAGSGLFNISDILVHCVPSASARLVTKDHVQVHYLLLMESSRTMSPQNLATIVRY